MPDLAPRPDQTGQYNCTCRNDAGMMDGCGEHASGTAAHSQGRSRLSREGVARGGCERVEERGARVRARGKVGLYFITGIKDPKRHARRAHARSHHLNTHTARLNEATEPTGEPDRLWSYLEETVLFADP